MQPSWGREFTRGVVAILVEAPIDAQLASLGRQGLIRAEADVEPGDDAYRFHHVLLRDAAYGTLTKRDRASLHERAAGWLDRDGRGDDAVVGWHLEQAVLYQPAGTGENVSSATAGERLLRAGMTAWRRADARAANNLLTRALELLPVSQQRSEAQCELALVLRALGLAGAAAEMLTAGRTEAAAAGFGRIALRAELELLNVQLASGKVRRP